MHNPIIKHTKHLQQLVIKSKTQPNTAIYLLENNVRTPLFMLESITRLLCKQNEEGYSKWLKHSKKLEDVFGELDYYNALINENKKINYFSAKEIFYLSNKLNKINEKLNKRLVKKDFYLEWIESLLTSKIDFALTSNKNFIRNLCKSELQKSAYFFAKYPKYFDDMELQVHELRRKLRWISIYTQSFDGLFLYNTSKQVYKWEKEFITKADIASKFNVLPINKAIKNHILINKKGFFALSSVIRQLGNIKDEGLKLHAKNYIEKKLNTIPSATVLKNRNQQKKKLLQQAHSLLKSFFVTHKIHELIIEN